MKMDRALPPLRAVRRRRPRRSAAVLAGLLLATPAGAAAQILEVTEEQEIAIGREAAKEIEQSEPILGDAIVTEYVGAIGRRLARHSKRPGLDYRFRVVDDAEINAFALPGGFVYVNRGLLAAAESESELAGVLAHEIGHVVGRHGVDQIRRAQLAGLGLGLLDALLGEKGRGGRIASLAAHMVATGAFMKFSREAEREADRLGARNAYDAGYDPRGMLTLFDKLAALRRDRPSAVERFFASHPSPEERKENVAETIASFPPHRGGFRDSGRLDDVHRRLESLPPPAKGPER